MTVNLPSTATTIAAADLPSANSTSSTYSGETTLTAYDNLGQAHTINLYFANEGGGNWEFDAYDSSTASANGSFPYSSGPLAKGTLTFNTSTGALQSGSPLSIPVPNGQNVSLDLTGTTQLSSSFAVTSATINGNAPGTLDGVSISQKGVLSLEYSNSTSQDAYIIPLADVPSPDNLTSVLGDAYQTNAESGQMSINNAQVGGLGAIRVLHARKFDCRPGDGADQHDPGSKRV